MPTRYYWKYCEFDSDEGNVIYKRYCNACKDIRLLSNDDFVRETHMSVCQIVSSINIDWLDIILFFLRLHSISMINWFLSLYEVC